MAGHGIRIEGVRKRYGQGDTAVDALKDVNMVVAPGEVVGLIGPSGSGKSTLLKCLGAVISPTAGRMSLGDETIYDDGWKVSDLRALRRDRIGFVFQAPYLIPFLDVTDNVALLPMLAGVPNAEPTAPLDSERAMAVIRILNDMARRFDTAIIVVTHDEKIIPTFRRIYHIRDGVTHEERGEGRSFD
jgi:putative ABC transport system ATP-binding protein